ncbi:MAG TPA: hypothetical protein VFU49_03965 [Ktedonobacteraceae bacterium]|nr:hypothetical protein [Ktedonobacteraceae bacterium]
MRELRSLWEMEAGQAQGPRIPTPHPLAPTPANVSASMRTDRGTVGARGGCGRVDGALRLPCGVEVSSRLPCYVENLFSQLVAGGSP